MHTVCVYFYNYLRTEYHVSTSSDSLYIIMKPNAKWMFRATVIWFFTFCRYMT